MSNTLRLMIDIDKMEKYSYIFFKDFFGMFILVIEKIK